VLFISRTSVNNALDYWLEKKRSLHWDVREWTDHLFKVIGNQYIALLLLHIDYFVCILWGMSFMVRRGSNRYNIIGFVYFWSGEGTIDLEWKGNWIKVKWFSSIAVLISCVILLVVLGHWLFTFSLNHNKSVQLAESVYIILSSSIDTIQKRYDVWGYSGVV
jgi:hypothetical protein